MLSEERQYVIVDANHWNDFRSVMESRGLDIRYSVEDSEDGIEYHIHDNLDEAEDILCGIRVLDEVGVGIPEPQLVF